MRPKSINMFQIFSWISIGLSILGLLIVAVIGGMVFGTLGGRGSGGVFAVVMLIPFAIVAMLGLLTYLVAQKRSGVARWFYVALAGLMTLFNLFSLVGSGNLAGKLVVLLMTGLLIASIVFLLMPDSNAWLSGASHYGQGGGYPPQHGGYPPHQQGAGYPPQYGQGGGGYPPQQGGYPPQQGGYPPQQGAGYPPAQGGGYSPQQGGGYPPQQGGGGYPPQ